MGLLGNITKLVETDVPQYKGVEADQTNKTEYILRALRQDYNQTPFNILNNALLKDPDVAARAEFGTVKRGKDQQPDIILRCGEHFYDDFQIILNSETGQEIGNQEGIKEDVELNLVSPTTYDALIGYTRQYLEAKIEQESEPKSNY